MKLRAVASASNNCEMDNKIEIKEEDPPSDTVASKNERDFCTKVLLMETNSDAVLFSDNCVIACKTKVKSENPSPDRKYFTKHLVQQINAETLMSSINYKIDMTTDFEEQTLVSDFGLQKERKVLPEDSVMKVKKCNSDQEIDSKVEIEEEPWWLETETSSVCDDSQVGAFPPVKKSSSLCTDAVSGDSSSKMPLPTTKVLGGDTSLNNGKECLEYEGKVSHIQEIPIVKDQSFSEQSGKCGKEKMYSRSLHLKPKNFIHKHERPHHCRMCDKSFTQLSNLKTHNLIHEGKKPHHCKTCNKRFTQLSNLKRHNLIHKGKKSNQCQICDKSFTQMSALKKHHLTHEGKKPHQCKTCDKGFTHMSNLRTHNLIHEGKKPHNCKICEKSFTQLSNLKRHNLIHEGKKPHQCKTCNKRFTQLSDLKRHNLSHQSHNVK